MNNEIIKRKKIYEKPEVINLYAHNNNEDDVYETSAYSCIGGWACT